MDETTQQLLAYIAASQSSTANLEQMMQRLAMIEQRIEKGNNKLEKMYYAKKHNRKVAKKRDDSVDPGDGLVKQATQAAPPAAAAQPTPQAAPQFVKKKTQVSDDIFSHFK